MQSLPVLEDTPAGALAVAFGDVDDDGQSELVVGHDAGVRPAPSDRVEVYRIGPDRSPELVQTFAASDSSGDGNSSNLVVGNVDSSVAGDEIVVAEDGRRRPAWTVRVFGGIAEGQPRLLCQFPAVSPRSSAVSPRFSARQPLAFALGHVVADGDQRQQEIVAGDAQGSVYVWRVQDGHPELLNRFAAFPDSPRSSARRLAVGDVLPETLEDEILVADDGTRKDGLVRVFDGRTGMPLLEFVSLEEGLAPTGVTVWVADVIGSLPGAEVIVGQGRAGGLLRVFSITDTAVNHVLDVPDPAQRLSSLRQHLAIGALIPDLPGNQVAVAQPDPNVPVQVFSLAEDGASVIAALGAFAPEAGAVGAAGTVDTIAVGP